MFYQIGSEKREIDFLDYDPAVFTAGYVTVPELRELAPALGFALGTVEACGTANRFFRSGVEVYDDYTFTELRISQFSEGEKTSADCVALYFKKNLFLVVDVEDHDGSTKAKFLSAVNRYAAASATPEKVVCAFLDALLAGDVKFLERTGLEISELETDVVNADTDKDFSIDILEIKKELLIVHNYYEQLLDITQALEENDNDIFLTDDLHYVSNVAAKIRRLREDADSLYNSAVHLQDAYQASLDLKLNNSMKFFTVLTTIFFPLTIIVGWYGMNFVNMPELRWKYGYVYVILLSLAVSGILTLIAKKRKWF